MNTNNNNDNKKVIILTGSTDGIGRNSLNYLIYYNDLKFILPVRNLEKGELLKNELKLMNPNSDITIMKLDLSSIESIKSFVEEFNRLNLTIDILVNNAGLMSPIYKKTIDNFETTFATNHLGTFLLTYLLLPKINKLKSNIVIVTSRMHYYVSKLDFENLESINESTFSSGNEYNKSKVCNLLFARELLNKLNNQLGSNGEHHGIKINTLHPGFQITSLSKDHGWFSNWVVLPILTFFLGNNINDMGKSLAKLALNESNVTGKYFQLEVETEPSNYVKSDENSKLLWDKTCKLLLINDNENLNL